MYAIIPSMDASDEKHFGETLRGMCGVFRVKFNTDLRNGYWTALKDMKRADFDFAVDRLLKTHTFMPFPAAFYSELRKGWQ